MTISVAIVTRNRAALLQTCLSSLTNQTVLPNEVIVIDNNSADNTQQIIQQFSSRLPIKSRIEEKIGIPYARNTSIHKATSEIIAFIDDDCIADRSWIENITAFYSTQKNAVGLIGFTKNMYVKNFSCVIEYYFYVRWLLYNFNQLNSTQKILHGSVIDFKNAAFKRSFLSSYSFPTDAPFGDVGDEDVLFGTTLFSKNQNIFFVPNVLVKHLFSTTMKRLIIRNFWNGYANQILRLKYSLDPSHNTIKRINFFWINPTAYKIAQCRFWYLPILFLYPIISKCGNAISFIQSSLGFRSTIPQR